MMSKASAYAIGRAPAATAPFPSSNAPVAGCVTFIMMTRYFMTAHLSDLFAKLRADVIFDEFSWGQNKSAAHLF